MTEAPQRPTPRVRLEEVSLADADLLDAWDATPEARGGINDFRMPPNPAPREAMAAGPLRNDHNGMLVVAAIRSPSLYL